MKKDLKRLVAFFICFVILLSSSITIAHADYDIDSNSKSGYGYEYYLDSSKEIDDLFNFTIADVKNLDLWIYNFRSFTVVKKYTDTNGDTIYKCYFNTPNLQMLAKTYVTSMIDDGYQGSTYNVNDTQKLVNVGKSASSENIMTKYGFAIPCNTYMGEYPKVFMSTAGVLPKTVFGKIWRAIGALFKVSYVKKPNSDNFKSLTYLNHTYIDDSQRLVDFFKKYYRPYFEKQIPKIKCENNDVYFKDVEEYLELAVTDEVASSCTEFNVNNTLQYGSIKIQRRLWTDWQQSGSNRFNFRRALMVDNPPTTYRVNLTLIDSDGEEYQHEVSSTEGEFQNGDEYQLRINEYLSSMPSVLNSVKNHYDSHTQFCYYALYDAILAEYPNYTHQAIVNKIYEDYGIGNEWGLAPEGRTQLAKLALTLNDHATWGDINVEHDNLRTGFRPNIIDSFYVNASYTWTEETGDDICDTCGNPVSNHHGFTDSIGPNGSQGADGLCDICHEASDDSRHDGAPDYEGQTVEHPNHIGIYTDANGVEQENPMTYHEYIRTYGHTYSNTGRQADNEFRYNDINSYYYYTQDGVRHTFNENFNYLYTSDDSNYGYYGHISFDRINLVESDFIDEDEEYIEETYEEYVETLRKYRKFKDILDNGDAPKDEDGYTEILYRQCLIESDEDDGCSSTKYNDTETNLSVSEVYIYSGIYKITEDYDDSEDELTEQDAQEIINKLQTYCGPYYPEVVGNMKTLMCLIAVNEDSNNDLIATMNQDDPRVMPFDVDKMTSADKVNYECRDPRVTKYKEHFVGELVSEGRYEAGETGSLMIALLLKSGPYFKLMPILVNIGGRVTEFSVFMQQLMDFNKLDDLGLSPTTMWSGPFVAMMMMLLAAFFIIKTIVSVIKMGTKSLWKTIGGFLILVFELGIILAIAAAPEKTWDLIKRVDSYVINLGEMAAIRSDKIDYLFNGAEDTEVMYYLPYFDLWSQYNTGYGLLDDEQYFDYTKDAAELKDIDKNHPTINGNDIQHYSVLLADSLSYYGETTSVNKKSICENGQLYNGNGINNNAYRVVDHFLAPRVEITQPTATTLKLHVTQNENYNGQFQSLGQYSDGFCEIVVKLLNCFLMCFLSLIKFLTFLWQWWVFYIFIFRVILGKADQLNKKTGAQILLETFAPTIALLMIGFYAGIAMRVFMNVGGLLGIILILFFFWLTFKLVGWWHGLRGGAFFPLTLMWLYKLTNKMSFERMKQEREFNREEKRAKVMSSLTDEDREKMWNEDGTINKDYINNKDAINEYKVQYRKLKAREDRHESLSTEERNKLRDLEEYIIGTDNSAKETSNPTQIGNSKITNEDTSQLTNNTEDNEEIESVHADNAESEDQAKTEEVHGKIDKLDNDGGSDKSETTTSPPEKPAKSEPKSDKSSKDKK